jgi:membrane dipeptidase
MIVDAHVDLAWNMLTFGRDYRRSAAETRTLEAGGPTPKRNGETMLGAPDWRRGGIGLVCATLFASPARLTKDGWDTLVFGDEEGAHQAYRRQVDVYRELFESAPGDFVPIRSASDLTRHQAEWAAARPDERKLGVVMLMEGADGVREPAEVADWWEWGVRAIGPVWMGANRYAGGTRETGPLTEAGAALLREMAACGFILDISHLCEESARQAIARYPGAVMASHSNPRALLTHARTPERHLSDETIQDLLARGAVIGIALDNTFLKDGWTRKDARGEVNLQDVVTHIDYVCQMAGDAQHVGLGSDFDGGFGLSQVPVGFESVADLGKIGEALAEHGYTPPEIQAVLGGNWIGLLQASLPQG